MHELKASCSLMKAALLRGELGTFADLLGSSWNSKKRMAHSISNRSIEHVFEVAMASGAVAGKVSGAGGGGFAMLMVDPVRRLDVVRALNALDGRTVDFSFTEGGCHGWKIDDARIARGGAG